MMTKVYNFSAGPAVLPAPVIKQVQAELPSYHGSGMSILEMSHRSSLYEELAAAAEANLRDLMKIPDDYDVLFLQGGGTLQFTMAPLNLARHYHRIGVVDSGHWAVRAKEEAELLPKMTAEVVATSQEQNYAALPSAYHLSGDYDYIHLTLNNTIEGTMYRQLPQLDGQVLVGDMSSNILAQRYRVADFGMIYAGAQKNIGPAGLTVVIVRHDLLDEKQKLPAMLDYVKQAKKKSALNTPPVFAIYVAGLVFQWVQDQGGVDAMQQRNEEKAQLLYDFLDNSKLFHPTAKASDRSTTNVPFVTGDAQLDQQFIQAATAAGLLNLKGHRSVGGMRASLYNAMPEAGVEALVNFMKQFELEH